MKVTSRRKKRPTAAVPEKRGKPVAQIVPVAGKKRQLFGGGKGEVLYMGDIISPIDVEWEAER